jgi:hypothetical protein
LVYPFWSTHTFVDYLYCLLKFWSTLFDRPILLSTLCFVYPNFGLPFLIDPYFCRLFVLYNHIFCQPFLIDPYFCQLFVLYTLILVYPFWSTHTLVNSLFCIPKFLSTLFDLPIFLSILFVILLILLWSNHIFVNAFLWIRHCRPFMADSSFCQLLFGQVFFLLHAYYEKCFYFIPLNFNFITWLLLILVVI